MMLSNVSFSIRSTWLSRPLPAGEGDRGALGGQHLHDPATDAAGSPRHQGDLSC
jgi:hypothetical protein